MASQVEVLPVAETIQATQQNQQAILTNAARYATLRKLALLSQKEQNLIASELSRITEPTLTGQMFDKYCDLIRAAMEKHNISIDPDAA